MTDSHRPPLQLDRAKLDQVIEPIVRAHGAEVVDVELKTDRAGWVLRIYVEKLGAADEKMSTEQAAVDLELCSNVARELSPALDVVDVIPHSYNLEVGSPGVERPLRGERDFVRFAGKKAKLRLRSPVRGQSVVVGILGPVHGKSSPSGGASGASDRTLTVQDGGATYEIPLSDVESGRLVFEFGPAPRPGKPHSQRPGAAHEGKKKKSH